MVERLRSMIALSRVRISRPSKPSIGLSEGSPWQATVTRRNVFSNTRSRGITRRGVSSLPLAVSVSRNTVARAGWTPMAKAALGGIILVVAPVSKASRTTQLPLGPVSCVYTRSRPASERSGYSGTEESDGVAFRQGFFRVDRKKEPLGLYHPVVDIVPVGRMGQQPPTEGFLSTRIDPIHGDQQPFSMESLTDLMNRLTLHSNLNISQFGMRQKGEDAEEV